MATVCIDTWKRQSTIGGVVESRDRKQQRRDVITTARYCSVIDNRPHLAIVKHGRNNNNDYDYYYNSYNNNNNNTKASRQSAGNLSAFSAAEMTQF